MRNVLQDFRSVFLPHVLQQRQSDSVQNFGCTPDELSHLQLRSFISQSELMTEWLADCIPRQTGRLRLGIGCDPQGVRDLERIYGESGAVPNLIEQNIFVFAEDGSGWPYCINVDSGQVFRIWSAWGDGNDRSFNDSIDAQWDSLIHFTAWLKESLLEP